MTAVHIQYSQIMHKRVVNRRGVIVVEGRAGGGGGRSRDGWSVGGVEPSTVTPLKPVIRFRAGITYVSRLLFSSHVI